MRERLALGGDVLSGALDRLHGCEGVEQCLILSTCNRTEVMAIFEQQEFRPGVLLDFLAREGGYVDGDLREVSYSHLNRDAVSHLFQVASGLDSMVLGETQILGQVKQAFGSAVEMETTGALLNRLMHATFTAAKRVRTESGINEGTLSVSQVACDLAAKIFSNLSERTVLLVGAGETAELTARILRERGVCRMMIANRTVSRAETLARCMDARVVPLSDLGSALEEADIVISSTASPEPLLTREMLEPVLGRRSRPMLIVDLAVPRDVESAVQKLDGAFVYDMDDLGRQVEINQHRREARRGECRSIIEEEVESFMQWHATFKVEPTIKELQQRLEEIRLREMSSLREQLSPEDLILVDEATRHMMKKVLVHPILHVKDAATRPDSGKVIGLIRDILGLKGEYPS